MFWKMVTVIRSFCRGIYWWILSIWCFVVSTKKIQVQTSNWYIQMPEIEHIPQINLMRIAITKHKQTKTHPLASIQSCQWLNKTPVAVAQSAPKLSPFTHKYTISKWNLFELRTLAELCVCVRANTSNRFRKLAAKYLP